MLTHAPTQEDIANWKQVFGQYKNHLHPNRISGAALYAYLQSRYPLSPLNDARANAVVVSNILENECYAAELPEGVSPDPVCSLIAHSDEGLSLYRAQEALYSGCDIFVGIDLTSGYFTVEGSGLLWDELFAQRGLNEADLKNYYLVAEYVGCLSRFGMLETTLAQL